jgi:hypothetical protein
MFLLVHDTENMVLMLILKYSLPQVTLILSLHMIRQKIVMALFQKVKHATIGEVQNLLQCISSLLPIMARIVLLHTTSMLIS